MRNVAIQPAESQGDAVGRGAAENGPVMEDREPESTMFAVSQVDTVSDTRPLATASKPNDGEVRSDSEAETVVLAGKEEDLNQLAPKSIKHEDEVKVTHRSNTAKPITKVDDRNEDHGLPRKEIASKAEKDTSMIPPEASYSSNLSSTISSPAHDVHTSSGAISESSQSKPRSSRDAETPGKELATKKRKLASDETDERERQKHKKRERSSEATSSTRRESSKPMDTRSASPQARPRHRAQSTHSTTLPNPPKRKKPLPLQVNQRRKPSEESSDESDDSGSLPSHPARLVSTDGAAMSPAKGPHRKLKDKNGRTHLARACANGDGDAVNARLAERPEDLNDPDNAGNTPLQIACLEGTVEVVEVLIRAGCNLNCANLDHDTPLIDAVENGHLDVIKLLLNAGADPRRVNAKGEEPIDLVQEDNKYFDEIRAALNGARAKDTGRRASEDLASKSSRLSRDPTTAISPRDSPALQKGRSPPPPAPIPSSRRRTARGEPTRNDLLWVNPTPETLRTLAGKGDDEGVDHILQMKPMPDVEAVLAAAKGGHEMCLQLLIAMGQPEHDPDPIPQYKPGYNTPMLASIGKGNVKVTRLLLEQSDFNPTRRLYRNTSYHELARERAGLNWQQEYRMLKDAFDKHHARADGSGKHRHGLSPKEKKKSRPELSSSPRHSSKQQSPEVAAKEHKPRKYGDDKPHKRASDDHADRVQGKARNHLRIPSGDHSRESSVVSDREVSRLNPAHIAKSKRSSSEAATGKEAPKARKRLISGKDRIDMEKQRRTSLVSLNSSTSGQERASKSGLNEMIKLEEGRDSGINLKQEVLKKRARKSDTPSEGAGTEAHDVSEASKKLKRQRLETLDRAKEKDSIGQKESKSSKEYHEETSKANSEKSKAHPDKPKDADKSKAHAERSKTHGTATLKSSAQSMSAPPLPGSTPLTSTTSANATKTSSKLARKIANGEPGHSDHVRDSGSATAPDKKPPTHRAKAKRISSPGRGFESSTIDADKGELSNAELAAQKQLEKELLEQQAKEKAARDEQERLAREKEQVRLETIYQAEEAEAKARAAQQEEESRLEQRRKEEEHQQKILERERARKEEHERQERRRIEQEEREKLARQRKQDEEERKRRESLPHGLQRAAELSVEAARETIEISNWLPLYSGLGSRIDPECEPHAANERWITNVQVAPILGITDLDLSQCEWPPAMHLPSDLLRLDTAWKKIPVDPQHRVSLWRVLRLKLARFEPDPVEKYNAKADVQMDNLAREKFFGLESLFWIRHSDLMDIVSRFPHLTATALTPASIALPPLRRASFSGVHANGHQAVHSSPHSPNGSLPNGFH